MEKKAKIIATLGPAIYKGNKLKQLVNLGVDAFRINFSHNTNGISKIVSRIRTIEKNTRVQYSNPFTEPCEYLAICLPAFSINSVNREDQ